MNIHNKRASFASSTCSLCSCLVRVWQWCHIHAGFHWSYHLEEVSKWSAAGTHSTERWHFEETLTALRRTRDGEQRGWEPETIPKLQRGDFHWNLFLQFGAHTPPSTAKTIQLNNPLWWGKEGNLERSPTPEMFLQSFLCDLSGGKNAEIKWIWHFCDKALLWAAHVAAISVHSCFGTLILEVGNIQHSNKRY